MNDNAMAAPPLTVFKVAEVPNPFQEIFERRGCQGTFIGSSEKESPWIPFGEDAAIRHLAFDVRNNIYSNILWIKKPGVGFDPIFPDTFTHLG